MMMVTWWEEWMVEFVMGTNKSTRWVGDLEDRKALWRRDKERRGRVKACVEL